MGPTNLALVQLFRADQQLREAQGRLEGVTTPEEVLRTTVGD